MSPEYHHDIVPVLTGAGIGTGGWYVIQEDMAAGFENITKQPWRDTT